MMPLLLAVAITQSARDGVSDDDQIAQILRVDLPTAEATPRAPLRRRHPAT